VSSLFAIASPTATPLFATIASITPSAAAIVAWRQPAESA
jgi:hypothetical protein